MQYKIDGLVEFNHALIYGFEPESSPKRLGGSEALLDALVPEAGQHQDMLAAYLFAQNTILPFIRTQGLAQVTENTLLLWIKTLHSFLGKTLLEPHDVKAGEYAQQMVCRWHHGLGIYREFVEYFSNVHQCNTDSELASFLEKEYQLIQKDGLAFINLLHRIKEDSSIGVHNNELKSIEKFANGPLLSGIVTMNKLSFANNTLLLSEEDKNSVEKVVKICMFPEEVPAAMQIFAKNTLAKYGACDQTDLKQITQFLAETFHQFTDIHPFPNGNGRTATCLINIFLRTFDLPSILLRYPGDDVNKNSLYTKAINQIDQSLLPLQALIAQRIHESQDKAFCDETLRKIIALRVGLSELIIRIHNKYPDFDIESMVTEVNLNPLLLKMDKDQIMIYNLTSLIAIAAKHEQNLDSDLKRPLMTFPLQIKLEHREIQLFHFNMEKLSGKKGWQVNQKNGLVTWVEVPNLEEALALQQLIQETGIMRVALSRRKDNKIPVIKCDNINYEQLKALVRPIEESIFSMDI